MLKTILNCSYAQGPGRNVDFVFGKTAEEFGELAVEVQISQGRLPLEKGGTDGIIGEACDLINCAVDLIYLEMEMMNPGVTIEMVMEEIKNRQKLKCQKWLEKAGVNKEAAATIINGGQ